MRTAHVLNGAILAIYASDQVPQSFKGQLLPVFETEQPPDESGSTWSVKPLVFQDRVELSWVRVTLSAEQKEAADNAEETNRIRTVLAGLRSGDGTAAERLARLERVVGHLCKLTIQA